MTTMTRSHEDMWTCTKCHESKPESEFLSANGAWRQPCKDCNRRRVREYNRAHREERKLYQQEFRQGIRRGRKGRPRPSKEKK